MLIKVERNFIIHSNPSVAIIVVKDDKIALIKQFRSTTCQYYVEIPEGIADDGESQEEAAIRETREETGLLVNNVKMLVKGQSLLDPSKSHEDFWRAIAEVYGRKARCLDETEQIEEGIIWTDKKEFFAKVKNQLFKGEYFDCEEKLFMSGHSLYALMAYMML